MEFLKLKNGVLISALALALSACGSSSSDAPVVVTPGMSGKVVDGYVSNATVTMDTNDNGKCETGEPTTLTTASGNFDFTGVAGATGNHLICASGGTDIATGAPFVGELKAPAGATQITPLTSLVVAKIIADLPVGTSYSATTAADTSAATTASSNVATQLGLTGTNLLTTDPVAVAATKPELLQTTTAIQVMLVQAAQSVAAAAGLSGASAPSATQTAELYQAAMAGISKAVVASSAVNLTSAASTAAINTMVTAAITNTVTALQAASATSTVNTAAVAQLSPTSVAQVAAVNVAKQAQAVAAINAVALSSTAVSGVDSATKTILNDTTASTVVANLVTVLTNAVATAVGSNVDFATLAANVTTGHETYNANAVNTAIASAVAAVNTAASSTASWVAVSAPSTPVTIAALTDVFALSSPAINSTSFNSTASTVSVTGPLSTASLTVDVKGTPAQPSSAAQFGVSLTEVGGSRTLSLIIDNVALSYSGTVVSASVPAAAKLIVTGTNAAGATTTATLTNVAANSFNVTNGVVTVDFAAAVSAIKGQSGFTNFDLVKGTFNVEATLSGVKLAKYSTGVSTGTVIPASFTGVSAGSTGVTGQGVKFQVVIK